MEIHIRPAIHADFDALRAIEIDAFETLRSAGAVWGDADSSSDEEFLAYLDRGVLLVAADMSDAPVGYVGAHVADRHLHVGEIDVGRDWQRRGVGRRLMLAVLAAGRARKLDGATLTTDRYAPFNADFYATLGFHLLEGTEIPDRLKVILAAEHAAGFDPERRVAMALRF